MDDTLWIPIILFLCIAAATIVGILAMNKTRRDQQETLRHAISAGQRLDKDTIALMARPPRTPEMDLRGGIIQLCVAVGVLVSAGILAAASTDPTGNLPVILVTVGIIIAATGAGQLAAWKVREVVAAKARKDGSDDAAGPTA